MRKCIKLRNISDLKQQDRIFPAETFAFVRAICGKKIHFQKIAVTTN